jgi:hypothetical protein
MFGRRRVGDEFNLPAVREQQWHRLWTQSLPDGESHDGFVDSSHA